MESAGIGGIIGEVMIKKTYGRSSMLDKTGENASSEIKAPPKT
jgi:hypothetical protein